MPSSAICGVDGMVLSEDELKKRLAEEEKKSADFQELATQREAQLAGAKVQNLALCLLL